MAIDKETRNAIAADLGNLTWLQKECLIDGPASRLGFGTLKVKAESLKLFAQMRLEIINRDLKAYEGVSTIIESLHCVDEFIACITDEQESS